MKEKTLLKTSLIAGFAGITILLIMSRTIEPKIEDLSLLSDLDGKRLISGNVVNIIEYNNSAKIFIARTEFIQIVVFDKENLDFLALKDGDTVEVIGELDDKQVIADEIRVI